MNRILLGDSVELIKTLDDNSVHAILSDIPYGISHDDWDVLHHNTNTALGGASKAQTQAGALFGRRGKPLNGWSGSDKQIPAEYQQWCASWAADWLRVLKPGATCFIFAGRRYAHRCILALEDAGFTFKEMLAWEKATAPHRAQRLSAIFSRRGDAANSERWQGWRVANPRPVFEPILWFQKPYQIGGTLADNVLTHGVGAWNEDALKAFFTAGAGNLLHVPYDKEDSGKHIAQKPLRLMSLLVSMVTLPGQLVLDPFAGSGTACVAAKQLGRNYIGFEKNPAYAAIAEERLAKTTIIDL